MLLISLALARPAATVGFDPADSLAYIEDDAGILRVHYSVEGPSQTRMADDDQDGIPDFAQSALDIGLAALIGFEDIGLRPPVTEAELGLQLGGSDAMDLYLVDFVVSANGSFRLDACEQARCAGWLRVDNDLEGFGNSFQEGLTIVVPHEFFHGVQYAYGTEMPGWVSEGTATWSVKHVNGPNSDFLFWSDLYLHAMDRPIDRPPGGITGITYGSGLFFDFLIERHDIGLLDAFLTEVGTSMVSDPNADLLPLLDALLLAEGDTLRDAFREFTRFNLAVGDRSGIRESYPYADQFDAPPATLQGSGFDETLRVFPWSMQTLRLDHPGGPLHLGFAGDDSDRVEVSLHPTDAGQVTEATWEGGANGTADELDLQAGTYWMILTSLGDGDSVPVALCVGSPDTACANASPANPPLDVVVPDESTGCSTAGSPLPATLLAPFLLLLARRRPC